MRPIPALVAGQVPHRAWLHAQDVRKLRTARCRHCLSGRGPQDAAPNMGPEAGRGPRTLASSAGENLPAAAGLV